MVYTPHTDKQKLAQHLARCSPTEISELLAEAEKLKSQRIAHIPWDGLKALADKLGLIEDSAIKMPCTIKGDIYLDLRFYGYHDDDRFEHQNSPVVKISETQIDWDAFSFVGDRHSDPKPDEWSGEVTSLYGDTDLPLDKLQVPIVAEVEREIKALLKKYDLDCQDLLTKLRKIDECAAIEKSVAIHMKDLDDEL